MRALRDRPHKQSTFFSPANLRPLSSTLCSWDTPDGFDAGGGGGGSSSSAWRAFYTERRTFCAPAICGPNVYCASAPAPASPHFAELVADPGSGQNYYYVSLCEKICCLLLTSSGDPFAQKSRACVGSPSVLFHVHLARTLSLSAIELGNGRDVMGRTAGFWRWWLGRRRWAIVIGLATCDGFPAVRRGQALHGATSDGRRAACYARAEIHHDAESRQGQASALCLCKAQGRRWWRRRTSVSAPALCARSSGRSLALAGCQ